MDFLDTLKRLAPTLITTLGGPLAGLAVEAVSTALGWDGATKEQVIEKLGSGNLTGAEILAVKQAENALVVRLKELDIRSEELVVQDRQGARDREGKVGGMMTPTLAALVVCAFVGVVFMTLFGSVTVDGVLAGTLIGYLSAKAEQVMSYYFGSSRGSDVKTLMIDKMQKRAAEG
jgi:hypothetical protein